MTLIFFSSFIQQHPHRLTNMVSGRMLRRLIRFPNFLVCIGAPESVSVGEIVGVCVFLVLNVGTIAVRVRRSLPRGSRKNHFLSEGGDAGKEEIDNHSWEAIEV